AGRAGSLQRRGDRARGGTVLPLERRRLPERGDPHRHAGRGGIRRRDGGGYAAAVPTQEDAMRRLEGKVAGGTGGSGGVGSPTRRRFVQEGAAVICADVDDEAGEKLVSELAGAGDRAVYQHTDVADRAQVRAAVDAAVDRFGRIDVLFNNAAASTGGYVADLGADGWERSLRVMLTASLYGMQAAIPHMLSQGGGSIIS